MEEELPMDSDSSDEDYVPAGCENEASEEESVNESADDPGSDAEQSSNVSKKRKKPAKMKKRKKIKNGKSEEEKEEEKENSEIISEEDKKKKSDLLWADFMKDCGPPAKTASATKPEAEPEKQPEVKPTIQAPTAKTEPAKVTQVLTFAGEEVRVEQTVPMGGPSRRGGRASTGGLSSVLSQISKKGKLSTLEKSKLDWDTFKSKEGIKEDLERHNKGRNGYLEKQDFLQRADLRQFEIEKNMRSATRRSLNR